MTTSRLGGKLFCAVLISLVSAPAVAQSVTAAKCALIEANIKTIAPSRVIGGQVSGSFGPLAKTVEFVIIGMADPATPQPANAILLPAVNTKGHEVTVGKGMFWVEGNDLQVTAPTTSRWWIMSVTAGSGKCN
jgi:hypothetical protein